MKQLILTSILIFFCKSANAQLSAVDCIVIGNDKYKSGQYQDAIECYTKAITLNKENFKAF